MRVEGEKGRGTWAVAGDGVLAGHGWLRTRYLQVTTTVPLLSPTTLLAVQLALTVLYLACRALSRTPLALHSHSVH